MYTLEDVYKTFPSGCTEDYKILRAFEMGKQEGGAKVKELEAQIEKMKNCKNCKKLKKEKDGLLVCTVGSFYTNTFGENCDKWEFGEND